MSMVLSKWIITPIKVGWIRPVSRVKFHPTYDHDRESITSSHPSTVKPTNPSPQFQHTFGTHL